MSKYNHMQSIPIDSISNEEINQAIKEWAEGDEALEKFLWACYEKGIKTSGCHAGARPYIDFEYQDGLDNLLNVTQKTSGSHIFVSVDGGNPSSGPDWYKPSVSLSLDTKYQDEADDYFNKLTNSLKDEISEKKENSLFKLLDFFIDKESTLSFGFSHTSDNQYTFSIKSGKIPDSRYNYYDNIFTKAGLIEDKTTFPESNKIYDWKIESNSLDDILRKMEYIAEHIINNYTLPAPISEDEILDYYSQVRFKKKTLPKDEFEKWFDESEQKQFKNYVINLIISAKSHSGEFSSYMDLSIDEKKNFLKNVRNNLNTKSIDELQMLLSTYQEQKSSRKKI